MAKSIYNLNNEILPSNKFGQVIYKSHSLDVIVVYKPIHPTITTISSGYDKIINYY